MVILHGRGSNRRGRRCDGGERRERALERYALVSRRGGASPLKRKLRQDQAHRTGAGDLVGGGRKVDSAIWIVEVHKIKHVRRFATQL